MGSVACEGVGALTRTVVSARVRFSSIVTCLLCRRGSQPAIRATTISTARPSTILPSRTGGAGGSSCGCSEWAGRFTRTGWASSKLEPLDLKG